jgi:hypothetical protein
MPAMTRYWEKYESIVQPIILIAFPDVLDVPQAKNYGLHLAMVPKTVCCPPELIHIHLTLHNHYYNAPTAKRKRANACLTQPRFELGTFSVSEGECLVRLT